MANDAHRSAGSISRKDLLAEAAEELRRFVACFLTVGEKAGDDHTWCLESSLGGVPDAWLDCTLARTCGDDNKMTVDGTEPFKKSFRTGTVRYAGRVRIVSAIRRGPYPVSRIPYQPTLPLLLETLATPCLTDAVAGGACEVGWTRLSARRSGEGGHLLEKGMPLGIHSVVLKTFLRVSKTVTRP